LQIHNFTKIIPEVFLLLFLFTRFFISITFIIYRKSFRLGYIIILWESLSSNVILDLKIFFYLSVQEFAF